MCKYHFNIQCQHAILVTEVLIEKIFCSKFIKYPPNSLEFYRGEVVKVLGILCAQWQLSTNPVYQQYIDPSLT
jgi:hypothetical protein